MPDYSKESWNRRQYLTATAVAGLTGITGCSGKDSHSQGNTSETGPPQTPQKTRTQTETAIEQTTDTPEKERIISDKPVVAHYMSGAMPHGFPAKPPTDPELYDPNGISGQIGGAHQTIPVLRLLHGTDVDTVEMAKYELECAKRFGVDAFDFYYPYTPDGQAARRGNDTIKAFFEAARKYDIDFRFTLCFSHPIGDASKEEKIRTFTDCAREVVDAVGIDSKFWLRTDDGRVLFYTWIPDGIIEPLGTNPGGIVQNPGYLSDIADAYDSLAAKIGAEAAWLYSLHYPSSRNKSYIDEAIEQFPAVKGWVSNCKTVEIWDYISQKARKEGTAFSQDVYGDFYDSMPHTGGPPGKGIHIHSELGSADLDNIWRRVHALDLSYNFRSQLQRAIDRDADLINLTSWNDYLEGHHIAPEINHNFGFAQLLQYYVSKWRNTPENLPEETAIAFFKKYPWGTTPDPYNVKLYPKSSCTKPDDEDLLEVVTILSAPAKVKINDFPAEVVEAGIDTVRTPMEPGPVTVQVIRDGSVFKEFTTPEWITENPFRTDRLTFSYSSEHERIFHELFGEDATVHVSQQYAEDEEGVPNWKREGIDTEVE